MEGEEEGDRGKGRGREGRERRERRGGRGEEGVRGGGRGLWLLSKRALDLYSAGVGKSIICN